MKKLVVLIVVLSGLLAACTAVTLATPKISPETTTSNPTTSQSPLTTSNPPSVQTSTPTSSPSSTVTVMPIFTSTPEPTVTPLSYCMELAKNYSPPVGYQLYCDSKFEHALVFPMDWETKVGVIYPYNPKYPLQILKGQDFYNYDVSNDILLET